MCHLSNERLRFCHSLIFCGHVYPEQSLRASVGDDPLLNYGMREWRQKHR